MSDVSTDQKTALVIGASRGIGAATARQLVERGYRVAGTHRAGGQVPDGVIPVEMELRDGASIKDGFAAALSELGRLDVLIVSSGITKDGLLMRASEDDILEVLRVNTVGPILAAKAALKPMMKQRSGSIVLLSSMSVKYGVAGQTTYTASKGAIEAFARSFAREYANRGLRINVVAPGTTDTDMIAAMTDDDRAAMMADVPMGRLATPDEIASAIINTAESTYMSGSTVSVGGGA
ncbi:SDR family NAD(P)-dependent oxidoreductase [Curtobacterium sp. MCBD17_040]|uniref:SDR family NAD(P)-dependent oxidoreductase n=1 Tax=Curtobacterium sp. MCBD17_040 TaxID=2175674 RepID=UPI000DA78F7B|nr:SDR family NAD(P)-dependent oxidoreductase [Curtobacterium sp. MCBD17_040]WIB65526.1 SDR family oxidoreductase [Curtobacterium sp. MCBD17_040]